MFALVDCNNFYVSCERVFDPTLYGKPVVVMSNNDGCAISRSDEAKAAGFQMGAPVFKMKSLIKQSGAVLLSSNYTLYGDMSWRVQTTLSDFSPCIEPYSIDEWFLDLGGIECGSYHEFGSKIKKTVGHYTGLPVGIGIGPTKSLAKVASKMAKSDKKYDGVCVLDNERLVQTALRNTLASDIWGIGRQYGKMLTKHNIITAYDFTRANDHWVRKNLTVGGLRIKRELMGESCIPLETMMKQKKAIATTRAFGRKTASIEVIREAVATYATRCAEKLRKQHSLANLLTVFIHTDPFNKNESYLNFSRTIALPYALNSQMELVKYALLVLKEIYAPGIVYKKAGVVVDGLEPELAVQTSLFDQVDIVRHKSISETTDRLNKKFGRDTLRLSVQGFGDEWKLKQEYLSGKFTTKLDDIIKIKAK